MEKQVKKNELQKDKKNEKEEDQLMPLKYALMAVFQVKLFV